MGGGLSLVLAGALALLSPVWVATAAEPAVAGLLGSDLQRRAEGGEAQAQYTLGDLYGLGLTVAPDEAQAVRWYRRAADQGLALAQYELGRRHLRGEGMAKDAKAAAEWLTRAADQGLAEAQTLLGLMYELGEGVPESPERALACYRKAADPGHAEAMASLARLYYRGAGVPQDYGEALTWSRKAAALGSMAAESQLALQYANGHGVPRDAQTALEWGLKAARRGDAQAQRLVADMYSTGRDGTPLDEREAVRWLTAAAERNDAQAQYALSYRFSAGKGVERNATTAARWLQRSARNGFVKAQAQLGLSYAQGNGVTRDPAKALEWYLRAARQGHAAAQALLVSEYGLRETDPASLLECYVWARVSAAGNPQIAELVEQLKPRLSVQQLVEGDRRAARFVPKPEPAPAAEEVLLGLWPEDDAGGGAAASLFAPAFGEDARWLIDTGAELTQVDVRHQDRLGKPWLYATLTSVAADRLVPLYRGPEILLGSRSLRPVLVGCEDLRPWGEWTGETCDGILGMDVLARYQLRFRPDEGEFLLAAPGPEPTEAQAAVLPFNLDGRRYTVAALAGEAAPLRLTVDSGDVEGFLSLNPADWKAAFPKEPTAALEIAVAGIGPQVRSSKVARLPVLRVGPYAYTNVLTALRPNPEMPSALGLGFLRQHQATLDFPGKQLRLSPAKRFATPAEWDMSGIHLARRGDQTWADQVEERSPAFEAGLRAGDRVLGIDAQLASDLSLPAVRARLRAGDGVSVQLQCERAGRPLTVPFRLKRRI